MPAGRHRIVRSATIGLLILLVVGYLGALAEVQLECRGFPVVMDGGMTGVMVGAAAGLVVFLFALGRATRQERGE